MIPPVAEDARAGETLSAFLRRLKLGGLVVFKATAPWCAPCKVIAPPVEALAAAHPTVRFHSLDVDQRQRLAELLDVRSIPTLIALQDGRVILPPLIGARPKAKLESWLAEMLAKAKAVKPKE